MTTRTSSRKVESVRRLPFRCDAISPLASLGSRSFECSSLRRRNN